MSKESSLKLLDAFYEAGVNFIDTENNYQNGTSEKFIREWMEQRGIRDQVWFYAQDIKQKTSYVGNRVKSTHLSVEESSKSLPTSYTDIFYVHWWDYKTSIEELMNGLHNLGSQAKCYTS
ncbi:Aldo/keto reductase [Trametes versicolor FP-101664 SS1]|uniref:Aldo/keto reductase n=1 Tax=Trametes versicolor (strain FP-101664) TaxID=717944 RepID=UPI0004622184|nr:Aldo/keto reductase [Trametes versicolor FP-101664 SS1]EIW59452.1 Aldo/keto reductase [Trametes versicolor FP-101664 SS1]